MRGEDGGFAGLADAAINRTRSLTGAELPPLEVSAVSDVSDVPSRNR